MAYNVMRDHYRTEAEYRKAIAEAKRRNPNSAKVVGGMRFFGSAEEKRTWQRQK